MSLVQCVAVCCSVLQCVAVCCSVLKCIAVCCSALQCVAVCCSVLQCVAVCCSVLQCVCAINTTLTRIHSRPSSAKVRRVRDMGPVHILMYTWLGLHTHIPPLPIHIGVAQGPSTHRKRALYTSQCIQGWDSLYTTPCCQYNLRLPKGPVHIGLVCKRALHYILGSSQREYCCLFERD